MAITPQTTLDMHWHRLVWSIEQSDKKAFIDTLQKIEQHHAKHDLLPSRRRLYQTSGEIMGYGITAQKSQPTTKKE